MKNLGRTLTKAELDSIKKGDSIVILWSINDVLYQAENDEVKITTEQAREVLRMAEDYHDANHGISWETLSVYIDMVVNK